MERGPYQFEPRDSLQVRRLIGGSLVRFFEWVFSKKSKDTNNERG